MEQTSKLIVIKDIVKEKEPVIQFKDFKDTLSKAKFLSKINEHEKAS